MNDLLTAQFIIAVCLGAIAATVPLLYASLGELVGEASGVLNLGIEGVMLLGAFTGFAVTFTTGQPWLGFIAAAAIGAIASLPMLFAVIFGLNQIVVGLAVYLGGLGLTSVLYEAWLANENPRITPDSGWMLWVGILLTASTAWWLRKTDAGLRLRAAGLSPQALDVAGISVGRVRGLAVVFGSITAALGGAYLSIQVVGSFTPAMTHGLGFLAIIVVMLSRTRVWLMALSALIYGVIVSMGTALQFTGLSLPNDVVSIAPFVLILAALTLSRFRTPTESTLGNVYTRGATL
jgi:ABC-type uncharacterized transport system permease subunit